ncbi:hypothetical protein PMAYCL1PPCAC_23200, partial [Pristionchus mayeri]
MLPFLALISLIGLSDANVDFTYSMLFDEYDLNAEVLISLSRCIDGGCSVFVSASDAAMEATKNIFVVNEEKTLNESLYTYASGYNRDTGKMKGLQLAGTVYSIINYNTGKIGPIAIYHVSSNAPLHKTTNTVEMYDGLRMNRPDQGTQYVTILSPDPYDLFVSALDGYLTAYMRATGFDNNFQRGATPGNCEILLD